MSRTIYLIILSMGIALAVFVQWNMSIGLHVEKTAYQKEKTDSADRVAVQLEQRFKNIYRSIRTIARLPGVRSLESNPKAASMDYSGKVLNTATRLTVQEIYNALASDVSVSELYIVPVDLDPDGTDPLGNSPREPITTFDSLIVGRAGTRDDVLSQGGESGSDEPGIEEIEIFEYRLMRWQIDQMMENYPTEDRITGLEYPMIGGPPVVTCDNSLFNPDSPDDHDREGLLLSVPFYGLDGSLRGCVSAVILTHALSGQLPSGDYLLFHARDGYVVKPGSAGLWEASGAGGLAITRDDRLQYSETRQLDTADQRGGWALWAGSSEEAFRSRNSVVAIRGARNLGVLAVIVLTVGGLASAFLIRRAYVRLSLVNSGLERVVADRTRALEDDVGRRKLIETELQLVTQRFRLAIQGSRDGIWDWDLLTDQVFYAESWKALFGFDDEEVGTTPDAWINRIVSEDLSIFKGMHNDCLKGTENKFERELRMVHRDGSIRWMLCRGIAVRDEHGRAVRLAGSLADITQIKDIQERLRRSAEHDQLTGLPNRTLFCQRLQRVMDSAARDSAMGYAVLFIDFDRFKMVNDSLGHNAGDALLISIADRFLQTLRPRDVAARFGGDEFAVLLTGLDDEGQAEEIADRLLDLFRQPHTLGEHTVTSTASIGMITSGTGYETPEGMIRDADAAMYQAKSAGRGCVVRFDKTMHEAVMNRLELEGGLRNAVGNHEFRLVYQPIVDIDSGRLYGFESLIRWDHPSRGVVRPDQFIGIAEDTGLIIEIGEWVLRESCRQLAEWNALRGHDGPICMHVNVSKRQLSHPGFQDVLASSIRESGVKAEWLIVEITESIISDTRVDVVPLLKRLKATGIKLAMDDFGTGHSSLSTLHSFPIDILKIDQSFVQSMIGSRDLAAVVHSIVTLANNMNISIVAEGIESLDQLRILQSHSCEYGQGYFFAKPMRTEEAERYLLDQPTARAA